MTKLGRNDACWCGSGAKYKKCHLNREHESRPEGWEIGKGFRQAFSSEECLAPEGLAPNCSKKIVRAHTVPKSGSLKKIARDGHVYAVNVDTKSFSDRNKMPLQIELVGINRASTFTGFCANHDGPFFSELENKPFTATDKQNFLLAYRASARELFKKKSSLALQQQNIPLDNGLSPEAQQQYQQIKELIEVGTKKGLSDAQEYKEKLEEMWVSGDFSKIRYYRISIKGAPPIMTAGGFCPEYDFEGTPLQDISDLSTKSQYITVTSFFGGKNGEIVFSWIEEDNQVCAKFVDSLRRIDNNKIFGILVVFFVVCFENRFMEPSWWEGLGEDKRNSLYVHMCKSASYFEKRESNYLEHDGISYGDMEIVSCDGNY